MIIRVDDKVIDLVEKICRALKDGKILADAFPIDEISNLIECTLGESFWQCIGSRQNYGFANMTEVYKEWLEKALERKDMEECEHILRLFECTYQAFYTALNEEEKVFRQRPYRQMIIDLGTVNSQIQYRLHNERQKMFTGKNKNGKGLGEGRGVVYTCLLGDKVLSQPKEINRQIDYLCFTNDESKWGKKEGVWKYCALEKPEKTGETEEEETMILESWCKIMAHKLLADYDYSIWVASNITIVGDVLRFCKVYGGGNSFLSFPSAMEDCIYEDMSITQMSTDDLNIMIRKMMLQYRKEGYPEHNGLIDGRVIVRNHKDEELCRIMEEWWKEVEKGRLFIGNVFNYMSWKYKFPFSICNLFIYENPYFRVNDIDLDTKEEI